MGSQFRFADKNQAGVLLAQRLQQYAGQPDVIVLALPRGGVPVGFAIAQALRLPLDILLVRKLGMPGHEEFAIGAIATGGFSVVQTDLLARFGIEASTLDVIVRREQREIERRETLYRAGRPPLPLAGRTVIVVDDGLATGATMQVAIKAVREQHPERVIIAVPVASIEACRELGAQVDDIVCLQTPDPFHAVGAWYQDFTQTTDDEVIDLLDRSSQPSMPPITATRPSASASPLQRRSKPER
jgi:putative phosphoribosyl transferase